MFLEILTIELDELISSTKTLNYENLPLNNPLLQAKMYCQFSKLFITGKPLLKDGKVLIDIKMKTNIFNKFFAEQCKPLLKDSVLPNQIFLSDSRLGSLDFREDEIVKLIRVLNINKAHVHDDIFIRMIKICDKSLLKTLVLLFQNSTKSSCNSDMLERSNIPVHKNNDKKLVRYYRSISLLPILSKIFKKLIVNRIYNFLLDGRLFHRNESGFPPSDSCVDQLLAISHKIFQTFDYNSTLEGRSVF